MEDKKLNTNEICGEKLENVAGGAGSATSITCPKCGGRMQGATPIIGNSDKVPKYICLACRHAQW